MRQLPLEHSFMVTPIFNFVKEQVERVGGYIHHDNGKETLQIYLSKKSFDEGDRYIGAIQYEGSNDYNKKEPHLVSWRFKRENLPCDLKQELEVITPFRKDKNTGTAINLQAESIAFKFEDLNENAKKAIQEIAEVLSKYTS